MCEQHPDPAQKQNRTVEWFAAALTVLLLIGITQWRAGAWSASYGAYPDEPAHFMGGLMVRDFLASRNIRPLEFAQNYYSFQPYFAIGYWPPLFYVVEGLWMLLFTYSRPSMMILTGTIAALLGLLLFATVRRWAPFALALVVTAVFLAIPSVQWSGAVLMTDLCVTLLCFAMTLAVGSYLELGTWRWAILAGLAGAAALLTKYLAVFVFVPPVLLILIDRKWSYLRNVRTWAIPAIVAAFCGPWVWWSRRIALIGFDLEPKNRWYRSTLAFEDLYFDLGIIVGLLALASMIWAVLRWRRLNVTQRLLCLQLPCLTIFLILGPSDAVERRYLLCGYPGLLTVAALAVQDIAARQKRFYNVLVLILAGVAVAGMLWSTTKLPSPLARQVARDLIAGEPASAILVPTAREGPVIAELSGTEMTRSGIMLLRPTKLLAHMNWSGNHYELLVPDVQRLKEMFDQFPIDVVVLAMDQRSAEAPHDRLLHEMLESDRRWVLKRSYQEPGVKWSVYRRALPNRMNLQALNTFARSRMRSVR